MTTENGLPENVAIVPFWLSDGSSDKIAVFELDRSTDPPSITNVGAFDRHPFTVADLESADWRRMIEYALLVEAANISRVGISLNDKYVDTDQLPESEREEIHARVYRRRDELDVKRVAELYVEGGGADGRGRMAVAEGMNVNPRTASRYITLARKAGTL